MNLRPHLAPYPNGWYLFGMSGELTPGQLLSRKFMGQEVTIFRTEAGVAHAVGSYCPHLGAHFGHGGQVIGDVLQCPFHGFQYDGTGTCVRTGYGTPVPPNARLTTWPLREQDGFLLVYHDQGGRPPEWVVPEMGTEGWTPLIYKEFILDDHPQETTENSVDLGHFAYVHDYRETRATKEFRAEGPYMTTGFQAQRALKLLGVELTAYDFSFETEIYGLGYSMVNVEVPIFRVSACLWVLPTSIDENKLILRLALRIKKWPSPIGALVSTLLARYILHHFAADAAQDFPIWENKRYLPQPALAKGDGPVGKYRQWARQFYRSE